MIMAIEEIQELICGDCGNHIELIKEDGVVHVEGASKVCCIQTVRNSAEPESLGE
jgi:hypothetical protein